MFNLGNGIKGLERIPTPIDLTVISPPYGKLRNYGGHLFDWQEFINLANQLWRVTTSGGIVCWQEGDSMVDGSLTDDPYRHLLYFRKLGFRHYETLYTRTPGGRPVTRHYLNPPQPVYVLSKGRPTTINLLTKPNKRAGGTAGITYRRPDGGLNYVPRVEIQSHGIKEVYWTYCQHNHTELPYRRVNHGATMHNELARDLILSYSRVGDLVCDPMAGLCTTGKWATLLGRRFIGWEIHEPYWLWGERRLSEARLDRLKLLR